jgi:hypothetical protein
MKYVVSILLILSLAALSFGFTFTDIVDNFWGRAIFGGYFAFMAYQILAPNPIVFEMPLGDVIGGMNAGPFIVVNSNVADEYKDIYVGHEYEHLCQHAVFGVWGHGPFVMFEAVRQHLTGNDWYDDNWFEVLARRVGDWSRDGLLTVEFIPILTIEGDN